jgi:hypothetical protein
MVCVHKEVWTVVDGVSDDIRGSIFFYFLIKSVKVIKHKEK